MPVRLGVDVSEFQGRPDWRSAHAAGVVFAFARVSFGTTKTDNSYAYNVQAIPAAGIVPGAYHFLTSTSSVVTQADHFVRLADPKAIHAVDVEQNAALDVTGWVRRYRQHYPRKPLLLYTGRDLWRRSVGGLNGAAIGKLWLAGFQPNRYVLGSGTLAQLWAKVGSADGALPWGGWSSWSFMQFSDQTKVPGISGGCDGDAFNGTLAELQALAGTAPAPAPSPWKEPDMVIVNVPGIADFLVAGSRTVRIPDQATLDAWLKVTGQTRATIPRLSGDDLQLLRDLSSDPTAAQVANLPVVDVVALAAALAPHLPPAVDPRAVATQVISEMATRLQA